MRFIFMFTTIIPIVLVGAISFYIIYSILDSKISNVINGTLEHVKMSLESTYSNLNYVSQQLTNTQIELYFQTDSVVERFIINREINEYLQHVSFTNPNTGLFYIFFPETNEIYYQNRTIHSERNMDHIQVLSHYKGSLFYAPHMTLSDGDELVFSVIRPVNMLKNTGDMQIHLETDVNAYDQTLNNKQYGMEVIQVLTNESREVVFSQDENVFPIGNLMPEDQNKDYIKVGDHYFFQKQSTEQGWHIYSIVHKSAFRSEITKLTFSWLAISFLSLFLSALLGWYIWKKLIYTPIHRLQTEINKFGQNQLDNEHEIKEKLGLTHVEEIDLLLEQFQLMRSNIWSLLQRLRSKEREKRDLEVEKLLAQINPHFMYNTLNTVQWLAKVSKQEKINELVTVFIRLLRYNLAKEGLFVTWRNEIEALKDYLKIQSIRYNDEFPVYIRVDSRIMHQMVPRFILQPLIENAIFYGLSEKNNSIMLKITTDAEDMILVSVSNQGITISEASFNQMIRKENTDKNSVSMGIGLNYVNTMLTTHYGKDSTLKIKNNEEGTMIYFRIPMDKGKGGESI